MHGLWDLNQMMFTKLRDSGRPVLADGHETSVTPSTVLLRLRANRSPSRDRTFAKGPADVPDPATSEVAATRNSVIAATKKLAEECFGRALTI